MGKSIRSKSKRTFRRTKREEGTFAVADAARLQRLSSKLASRRGPETGALLKAVQREAEGGDSGVGNDDAAVDAPTEPVDDADAAAADIMDLDNKTPSSSKVSTHGPRNSRREQWRASKGLVPRKTTTKINKQGVVVSTKKAGRSQRRR